jgi:hypothetical protein
VDVVRFSWLVENPHPGLLGEPVPLTVVAGGATGHHVFPAVLTASGHRENVIPCEELTPPQLAPVPTAVLARVPVPGEEEGVGDLAAEAPGDVNESNEADDEGKGDRVAFRAKRSFPVHLQNLRLPVQHQPDGPSSRDNG